MARRLDAESKEIVHTFKNFFTIERLAEMANVSPSYVKLARYGKTNYKPESGETFVPIKRRGRPRKTA